MTAAYRLKGIGWFGGCTAIVLCFYLVSLQVAAERKKLEKTNAEIGSTQRDIRALETEFDTRANLAQLEKWNGDTLALSAPQPGQFVSSEGELAAIDPAHTLAGSDVKMAALVVPSLPDAPVAVASQQIKAPVRAALRQVAMEPQVERAAVKPAVVIRAHPEVAMLDGHLLSESTLGDLVSGARREGHKR